MKVLLIDDHALFRVGLKGLLERRGIGVVDAVGDWQDGLELIKVTQFDVILLDMRMPDMNGIQVLQRILKIREDAVVVMLTTSSNESDLVDALRNGARGYLLKDMEPDELVLALRDTVSGKAVVAPGLAGILANVVRTGDLTGSRQSPSPFDTLTPREAEILGHLSEGQSNKVIAKNLDISDGTVKLHVKAILRKLGVHSRVEAAVMAVEKNIGQKNT